MIVTSLSEILDEVGLQLGWLIRVFKRSALVALIVLCLIILLSVV